VTEQELAIDAVRRLKRAGIAYLLTGSMASNYWGIPRTTHDLDFVVQLPLQSIPSLLHEFRRFLSLGTLPAVELPGAHQPSIQCDRSALSLQKLISGCFVPTHLRCRFSGAASSLNLLGEPTWIATAEDVMLHKLYWDSLTSSERQISDAAGVVAVQSDSLDRAYLQKWAGQLGVSEKLNKLLARVIKPKNT
jgi:hypothetical protein